MFNKKKIAKLEERLREQQDHSDDIFKQAVANAKSLQSSIDIHIKSISKLKKEVKTVKESAAKTFKEYKESTDAIRRSQLITIAELKTERDGLMNSCEELRQENKKLDNNDLTNNLKTLKKKYKTLNQEFTNLKHTVEYEYKPNQSR